jgi:hypothetical protein
MKVLLFLFLPFLAAASDTIPRICIDTVRAERIAKDLLKKENLELQNENLQKQLINIENIAGQVESMSRMFQVTIMSQQESIHRLTTVNSAGVEFMSGIKQDIDAFRISYYNKNIDLELENKDLKKSIKRKNTTIVILSSVIAATIAATIAGIIAF